MIIIVDNFINKDFLKDFERNFLNIKPWFLCVDKELSNKNKMTLGHNIPRENFTNVENYFLFELGKMFDTSKIHRCFYNCFRKGDLTRFHTDPGSLSYMIYLNSSWNRLWGGCTEFKKKKYHIPRVVYPKPGRLVVFDSKLLHRGKRPNFLMPDSMAGRMSLVFHEGNKYS